MLYGGDSEKLPLSRFKRINSPSRWSFLRSPFFIIGALGCWQLFRHQDEVINGNFFQPFSLANWSNYFWFFAGMSFLIVMIHRINKSSFGIYLKSFSLKDIEIASETHNQESILNKHLDEIIYFFQSTKYDLVIIEDLDRFNSSDIFVTLREINSLINSNSGVKRKIRFLYALRDDIFMNVDRTKFFEFIIPVIPIVNSSNSIDIMLEQARRLSLDGRLSRQFLRDVSRYLNDMRLINNIFNEYAVYLAILEGDGDSVLEKNKLLAVLIYKNVFPKDFEHLHLGQGNFANILKQKENFVAETENIYKIEIKEIEGSIKQSEQQIAKNLIELRRIYAMALIEKLPIHTTHIKINGNRTEINRLSESPDFDQIINVDRISYVVNNAYEQYHNIASFQSDVDNMRTFKQRSEEIQQRSAEFRTAKAEKLRELRTKLSALRSSKFHEIVRLNANKLNDMFEVFGDNKELARFLVLEGYLDDTYYQYTSLFHAGRLSPNDNKYLIQIRSYINPHPNFPIDNAREVVAEMRNEDFNQRYVLNVKIVDCLLGDEVIYASQIGRMFEYIAANFEDCEDFFKIYYAQGSEVPKLVGGLYSAWPSFVPTLLSKLGHLSHIGQLIAHLPEPHLTVLPAKYPEAAPFVSKNLARILELGVEFEPSRLKNLGIELEEFSSIEAFPAIAQFLFEEGLYSLTVENIEFIFSIILGVSDLEPLRTRHFTTINASTIAALISRIEHEFVNYLKNVLLQLESNTRESAPSIIAIINREEVELDSLSVFLSTQTATIPSLEAVPTRLHARVFQLNRIEATWANCLAFINSDDFDAASLTDFLAKMPVLATLQHQAIPGDDKAAILRQFLINNDALQDNVYQEYIKRLPYKSNKFPSGLGLTKIRILILEAKVDFSKENLETLKNWLELQVLFVVKNIESYLRDEVTYQLGDDFREILIDQNINDFQKLALIQLMDLTLLPGLPLRSGKVGIILDRTGTDLSAINDETARAMILNSSPVSVQISLLNKYHLLFNDDEVRDILASLPKPFSEIRFGYNSPRLEKTLVNTKLVEWLAERNIISSWKNLQFGEEIRINLYRRDHTT